MPTPKAKPVPHTEIPPTWKGSFRPNGSYWAEGPGTDPLTRTLLDLCSVRRLTEKSPADFVPLILGSPCEPAFNPATLEHWLTLPNFSDWRLAVSRRSSEAFLIHEGRSPRGRIWDRGRFVEEPA